MGGGGFAALGLVITGHVVHAAVHLHAGLHADMSHAAGCGSGHSPSTAHRWCLG